MKKRHVFSASGLPLAEQAMAAARQAGVENDDILLVARSDIEKHAIPDKRKMADTDLMGAVGRGAGYGAATGLLAGLVAVAVPPLGITLAGAAAVGLAGAMVGSLGSALLGATVPDPVRQTFDDEIQAGNILLVIDGEQEVLDAAAPAIVALGLRPLPYESTSALT
ncbi:hypothetical protein CQ393_00050 [Stenotrophomonas sp. MYb238]|jgi:uncharacterized membrane protein|uniref:hypothetical protein n=1 Tax=Stenotrophomonas sp. MYb238 TaxID=2040281 RepID=UPI000E7E0D2F|nr:hypothetical protein [Stenotrophomonas sp. MYb238]MQP74287.1 hypothetical protein [Stenotrophomonas sp. MYb238]HBN52619.1 hypothetical protein [Stenotrophomonas sp.]